MYCVIYRTGGTANFKWVRSLPFGTRERAESAANATQRAGYVAHVEVYKHSVSIGLPETYDAATPLPEK
jgi:hypothetical protein